jgi:hypothetical protein
MHLIKVFAGDKAVAAAATDSYVVLPYKSVWSVRWVSSDRLPIYFKIRGKGIKMLRNKDGHYSLPQKFSSQSYGASGVVSLYGNIECTDLLNPKIVFAPKLISEELFVKIFRQLQWLANNENSAVSRELNLLGSAQSLIDNWILRSSLLLELLQDLNKFINQVENSEILGTKFQLGEVTVPYLIRNGLMAFSISANDEKLSFFGPRRVADFDEVFYSLRSDFNRLQGLYEEIRDGLSRIQNGGNPAAGGAPPPGPRKTNETKVDQLLLSLEKSWVGIVEKLSMIDGWIDSLPESFYEDKFSSPLRRKIADFQRQSINECNYEMDTRDEWLFLDQKVSDKGSVAEIGVVNEDLIYERWVTLQVVQTLLSRGFKIVRTPPTLNQFFTRNVNVKAEDVPWLHLENARRDKISMVTEPPVWRDAQGAMRIGSRESDVQFRTPDLFIKFQDGQGKFKTRNLVFDAKYKNKLQGDDLSKASEYRQLTDAEFSILFSPQVGLSEELDFGPLVSEGGKVLKIGLKPINDDEAQRSWIARLIFGYFLEDYSTCWNCGEIPKKLPGDWNYNCERCEIRWRVRSCKSQHRNMFFDEYDLVNVMKLPENFRNGVNSKGNCLICEKPFVMQTKVQTLI